MWLEVRPVRQSPIPIKPLLHGHCATTSSEPTRGVLPSLSALRRRARHSVSKSRRVARRHSFSAVPATGRFAGRRRPPTILPAAPAIVRMFDAPWLRLAPALSVSLSHSSSAQAARWSRPITNGAPASMASGPCSNGSRRRWSARHEPRPDHPGSGHPRCARLSGAKTGRKPPMCCAASAAFDPIPASGEAGAVSPSMPCYRFHAKTRVGAKRMSPGSPHARRYQASQG